jgi:hypothetical protein
MLPPKLGRNPLDDALLRRMWADEVHVCTQKAADKWGVCYYFEGDELVRSAVRPPTTSLWPGKIS